MLRPMLFVGGLLAAAFALILLVLALGERLPQF